MTLTATGVGSLPGTAVADAVTMPFAEGLDLPYLAELPARGPGADMIGRTAARLIDLAVEIQPSAWRLTRRGGIDVRRANDYWAWDLDALQQAADGYAGSLKLQLTGPWTLAAAVELPNGHRVLTDPGAVRDLQVSLAEGAAQLVDDVRRRVPGAEVVLQLDEPSLPAVLGGRVPTASGAARIAAVGAHEVGTAVQRIIEHVGVDVLVHCCAADVPFRLLRTAGAAGVLFDAALFAEASYDDLGEAVDAGLVAYAGVVPADAAPSAALIDHWAERARRIASIAAIAPDQIDARFAITTSCGLAGTTWRRAVDLTRAVRAVAGKVTDSPEAADA